MILFLITELTIKPQVNSINTVDFYVWKLSEKKKKKEKTSFGKKQVLFLELLFAYRSVEKITKLISGAKIPLAKKIVFMKPYREVT